MSSIAPSIRDFLDIDPHPCIGGPVADVVPETKLWSHEECAIIVVGIIAMREGGVEVPCGPPFPCGFEGGEFEPGFVWPVTLNLTRGMQLHLDNSFANQELCQFHLSSGFAPSKVDPGFIEAIFCSEPSFPRRVSVAAYGRFQKITDADGSNLPDLCPQGQLCGIASLAQPEWVEVSYFSSLNACGGVAEPPGPEP